MKKCKTCKKEFRDYKRNGISVSKICPTCRKNKVKLKKEKHQQTKGFKESERKRYKNLAIYLAKKIAKERDNYTCQKCGKKGIKVDGAHIIPVGFGLTACNPKNIITLCSGCHTFKEDSWHNHPKGQGWFDIKYPNLYKELERLSYPIRPINDIEWKQWYEKLKSCGYL